MALFGFGKKKEEKKAPACCCGGSENKTPENTGSCCGTDNTTVKSTGCCSEVSDCSISMKVLGAGCKSCHEQYENAKAAVKSMGLSVEVEYITDMEKVMGYGVMSMPAIVVNEKVVSMGKVLKTADVEKLLHKLGF
ncbi:MAG: thioredoxin family protein [Lachnospiraceae bacterium]|nr:thioredoxin family protein [Lachnospiraceae bacterium]